MAKIKKAFEPIIEYLRANQDAVVADILGGAEALAAAKTGGGSGGATTFLKDTEGNTVAILDYYFKRWMPLIGDEAVEFGAKKGSASGYSTMSKLGTSLWTKQQREAKAAMQKILEDVESGELAVEDIADRKAEIEAARAHVEPTDLGFETKDEVIAYLADYGVTVQ